MKRRRRKMRVKISQYDLYVRGSRSSGLYANAAGAIILSVVGMTGMALETRKWLGGGG
jgi:hypothetical protein